MGRRGLPKGRTSKTYHRKLEKTKKWYKKRIEARKSWSKDRLAKAKSLKPLEFYTEKIKQPNGESKKKSTKIVIPSLKKTRWGR